jgi:Uma2 family endonuclease
MAAHKLPPPLREGDRLTSDEFIRRWEAMPDLKRVELIDGIVYMPSPLSYDHGDFQSALLHWLCTYEDNTPGCRAGAPTTWLMSKKDVPEPDVTLRILPEYGGRSQLEGIYIAGAPELLVEVALSSRSRDTGVKLKLYQSMGVREYLIAIASEEQFLWNILADGVYHPLAPDSDGILRSRCFPGLWLDPAALWRRDRKQILAVLQQGLASPEHAGFVTHLAGQKS